MKTLANLTKEQLAAARGAADTLWEAAKDFRKLMAPGAAAQCETHARNIWDKFGRATDCSICRGFHGPEIKHACE